MPSRGPYRGGEIARLEGPRITALLCFAALTLDLLHTWLVNHFLYPTFVALLPEARDAASACGVAATIALALFARRRPEFLREGLLSAGFLAGTSLGFALILLGQAAWSPALLLVGAVLRGMCNSWFIIMIGIALCRLRPRSSMLAIAAAFLFEYAARAPLVQAPLQVGLTLCFAVPFLECALILPAAREGFRLLRAAEPPVDAAITEPRAYLPFGHALFAAIFAFRLAYGAALTIGMVDGVPQTTFLAAIPLAGVFLLALARRVPRADALYVVAALFVVAGFLAQLLVLGAAGSPIDQPFVTGLYFAGSECFGVLMWFALASIGARNPGNALMVVAWGKSTASAGLLVGATVGHLTNAAGGTLEMMLLVEGALLAFVALNLTFLKGFSFQDTIDGVRALPREAGRHAKGLRDAGPDARAEEPGEAGSAGEAQGVLAEAFDARCEEACSGYRLTKRETEIFLLLAHGRNVPFIQERLVISRNTVKTHVQNIYAKLGVHSQQELIDLVEGVRQQER